MSTKKTTRNSFLLVLAALIWGTAFVAQSEGGDVVGAYTFNCIRNYIGAAVLIPVILFLDRMGLSRKPQTAKEKKDLLTAGISCGIVLCIASNLQQIGINMGTPAGKAGFLTACYIILVPILGLFLRKKCTWNIWLGVALTVVGLYLLCMKGSFSLQPSDLLLMLCALCFSIHILVIDHFSPLVDGVRLSSLQFLVVGILTVCPMLWTDMQHSAAEFTPWLGRLLSPGAMLPILYAAVFSSGIAYTLQIVGQKDVHPTIASLLMSLESVFSVLAGWLLLHEALSARELGGCALIFIAVVLAQLPMKND